MVAILEQKKVADLDSFEAIARAAERTAIQARALADLTARGALDEARILTMLGRIGEQNRKTSGAISAAEASLGGGDLAVVVVRCRHCQHEQPTPIDWSAPCGACGGER